MSRSGCGYLVGMELPPDDGQHVDDEQWAAVRDQAGAGEVEEPTLEEKAALLEAIRKSRP